MTGARRRFAVARVDLAALHAAGRRHGGTVNDALLTAVGGALHTLLDGRGEHVATFRVAVMVAGRRRRRRTPRQPGRPADRRRARHRYPRWSGWSGWPAPSGRHGRRPAAPPRAADAAPLARRRGPLPPLPAPPAPAAHPGQQRARPRPAADPRRHRRSSAIIPIDIAEAGNLTVTVVAPVLRRHVHRHGQRRSDQVPDLPVLAAALQAELDGLAAAEVPCRQDQRPQRRAGARSAASDARFQGGRLPMQSRDVMTENVVTVTPATTVKDAAELMAARGFTALPVLDADGDLIGLVTEADVVRGRFPHDPRYHPRRVRQRHRPARRHSSRRSGAGRRRGARRHAGSAVAVRPPGDGTLGA